MMNINIEDYDYSKALNHVPSWVTIRKLLDQLARHFTDLYQYGEFQVATHRVMGLDLFLVFWVELEDDGTPLPDAEPKHVATLKSMEALEAWAQGGIDFKDWA
jgi:hypothetical protein